MTSPGDWVLAVDFGTTNTVAAVRDAQGVKTLSVDGHSVMPSAVFLDPDGKTWSVGDTAERLARSRLEWFEPNPKGCVPNGSLFLGGRDIPVGQAITALLRPIVHEAAIQHDGQKPLAFMVTHPADWGGTRVSILVAAATAAGGRGWPVPQPISEPVAAAQAILGMTGIPPQARVVVLDLGGGTVDATTVDRDGETLTVVGQPKGRDGLGGEDYDQRLARWMTAEVGAPGLYDRLASSEDPDERERAIEIRTDARKVKEQLSFQAVVPAQLPKSPPELPRLTPVQISRPQLEDLICGGAGHEPGLAESVEVASDVLNENPPGPPFAGVFLTGGCSRIPMLGRLVQERTKLRPLTYGDPTTAVAQGAAEFAWRELQRPAAPPPSPPPPPPPGGPQNGKKRPAGGSPPGKPEDAESAARRKRTRRLTGLALSVLSVVGLIAAIVTVNVNSHKTGNLTPVPSTTAPTTPAPTTPAPIPTAPATTAPLTSGLSSGEQQLASMLNSNYLDNCTGRPSSEINGVLAALNCDAVNSGPSLIPLVVQFSDVNSAQSWLSRNTSGIVDNNDCAAGQKLGAWTYQNSNAGTLGCMYASSSDFRMIWVIGSADVGVIADGTSEPALLSWWHQDGCVLENGC